jgi:DNA-binding LacI/PurR family transcriptional regulator
LIAHFLVEGGHKRIAFIAGSEDSSTNRDREAGFYRGLAESGHTVWARAVGNYSFEGAADAARQLCAAKIKPDAIFVANDHMAFSVMDVLRNELKLRIPNDISIVGYDDVPEASWGGYNRQPSGTMIEATISILMEQIQRETVSRRAAVLPAELIIRQSARLPKEKS